MEDRMNDEDNIVDDSYQSHKEVGGGGDDGSSNSEKILDDDSLKRKGKRKKRRVKRRKRRDEDDEGNRTDGTGDDDEEQIRKTSKKRTKKSRSIGSKKQRVDEYDDVPGHGFGRYAYESAPQRPRMENNLKGPHHKLLTKELEQRDDALVSLRLPRLSPLLLVSECWTPAWSVKREQDLRQARYNWIQYQTKNPDLNVDLNELEHYDLQAKGLRVSRMPDATIEKEDGSNAPVLIPNSWIAKWSDNTITIHVGNDTTLILSPSNDKCVMVKVSKGLTTSTGQMSYNDFDMEMGGNNKEVDVYTATGVIEETLIAKFSSSEGGFEQRKSRLRDILRKSANTKKTVQLLNLNEIAKMSNVQKRQEEMRQNDMMYRRNRDRRGQRNDLNASYLEEGDDSSYD